MFYLILVFITKVKRKEPPESGLEGEQKRIRVTKPIDEEDEG